MSAIKRRIGLIGFGAIGKDVATRLLSVSSTPLDLTVLTRKLIPGVSCAFKTASDAENIRPPIVSGLSPIIQDAPIRMPTPSTMAPPRTIWNAACRNGASRHLPGTRDGSPMDDRSGSVVGSPYPFEACASTALPARLPGRADPDRWIGALVVRGSRTALHPARLHR